MGVCGQPVLAQGGTKGLEVALAGDGMPLGAGVPALPGQRAGCSAPPRDAGFEPPGVHGHSGVGLAGSGLVCGQGGDPLVADLRALQLVGGHHFFGAAE
jgi:hypothetical protein